MAEKSYGGYYQQIGTGPLGALTLPATPETEIELTYQYGQLATRRYKGAPFYLINRTIDRNTGLPSASYDVSGIRTDLEFDNMGRLTWQKPEAGHDAWKQMAYTPATSPAWGDRARVRIFGIRQRRHLEFAARARSASTSWAGSSSSGATPRPAGSSGSPPTTPPATSPGVRSGEAGTRTAFTYFNEYDPFGRAHKVDGPDGKTVRSRYWGDSGLQRWWYIGASRGSDGSIGERKYEIDQDFDAYWPPLAGPGHQRPAGPQPRHLLQLHRRRTARPGAPGDARGRPEPVPLFRFRRARLPDP